MRRILMWIGIGLVVLIAGANLLDMPGRKAGRNVSVGAVDFSEIGDGVYTGRHKSGRWSNKVLVTVESGRVTDIDVVEDVLFRSAEWTEKIIDSVMEEQSLDVDIISGATITTKAYLKAIENALTAGE